jgi:hypothetical protein
MINIQVQFMPSIKASDKPKLNDAIGRLQGILSNTDFYQAVGNYINRHGVNKFTDSIMSPPFVAWDIKEKVQTMSLKLAMYRTWNPWSSVVAYHEGGVIYLNRWKYAKATAQEVSGTLAHEFMHVLGYEHSFRDNPDRADSVPYVLGKLVARWN